MSPSGRRGGALKLPATAARAASATWRSSATASTRPRDFALPAVIASAGQHKLHRFGRVDLLGETEVPPRPGCRPSLTSGKPSVRAGDGDPLPAGERELEPPPRQMPCITATVGRRKPFQAVDDRDARPRGVRAPRPAPDAGEHRAGRRRRRNRRPWRSGSRARAGRSASISPSARVELAEHRLVEIVLTRSPALVEQEPGDAGPGVRVRCQCWPAGVGDGPVSAAELQRRLGEVRGQYRLPSGRSSSMAPPWPPPMHSVAMPRLSPSRCSAFDEVEDDAAAARADRVAEADRAAVDVQPVALDRPAGSGRPRTSRQ